jgi:outer membrane cobalamin receptor
VTVAGQQSEAQKLQDSAEAVTVVSTAKARRRSADLGEVLARAQGIGIRRRGGLGSDATVSLNGLQDDQVRIFMDGVPLELAGYSFGLVNVPVNLVERVEIYRGVVPIRFGADALGGVINVVTDQRYETHAGASYQTGSWGTHRATLNGRYRHEPTGIVGGAAAFFDFARNDYWMHDRRLATPTGGTIVRSVRRFHDAYQAYGANVEVGVVEKKWAKKLLLQAFYTHYRKELQHNANMTVPYGEIVYGGTTYGGTVRYEANLSPEVEVEALLNYTFRDIDFQDLGTHVYTWEGERGRPVGRGGAQGERLLGAFDLSDYEYGIYGRLGLQWELVPRHFLRTSATPYSIKRRGEGYVEQQINLTGLDEKLRQMVTGIEYEANLFGDRLSNVIFGKGYFFASSIEERTEGTGEIFTRRDNIHRFGGGDALRYRFTPWFLAKASYEYATRLPRPDELFGNGVLIDAPGKDNPITPEMSHNINLGPRFELEGTESGSYVADINGFARFSEDMIVLLLGTGAQSLPYANISDARTLGVEGAVSWSSPGKWLTLEGSLTYQDVRNTSTEGPFASQNGLRIPSRPYLFASWGSSLQFRRVLLRKDSVEPFYLGRYTHGFYRGWDLGDPTYKQSIASQVSHSLGLSWFYTDEFGQVTLTGEVENLTDAMLYDVFGEQRPGRAFYVKLTGQI